jgi:O-antigen ligase
MPGLMAFLGGYYLLSQGFDSLLRWLVDLIKVAPLIYARDGAMIFVIVLGYVDIVAQFRAALVPFALLTFLIVGCVIGAAAGLPFAQLLFGFKVWLPLLLGFFLVSSDAHLLLHRPKLWSRVWAVLVLGIIANVFVTFPWAGMLMQVGETTVEANREWDAGGFNRVSGFSRTSFDAAICILLLALYLMVAHKKLGHRVLIWMLSGVAVVLTTTKGAVGAYLVATLLLPLVLSIDPERSEHQKIRRVTAQLAVTVLALVAALVPLFASQVKPGYIEEGTVEFFLFASFGERMSLTWPTAFGLLDSWQFVTGRGIGGIGAAQTYFELDRFCPADSLFVYVYVTAGLVGVALYLALIAGIWTLNLSATAGRLTFFVLLFVFVYGTTVNVVESAVALMSIGAAAAQLSKREVAPSLSGYGYPEYSA